MDKQIKTDTAKGLIEITVETNDATEASSTESVPMFTTIKLEPDYWPETEDNVDTSTTDCNTERVSSWPVTLKVSCCVFVCYNKI